MPGGEGNPQLEKSYIGDAHRLIDLRAYRNELANGGSVVQLSAGLNAAAYPENEKYVYSVSIDALDAETALSGAAGNPQKLNPGALAISETATFPWTEIQQRGSPCKKNCACQRAPSSS